MNPSDLISNLSTILERGTILQRGGEKVDYELVGAGLDRVRERLPIFRALNETDWQLWQEKEIAGADNRINACLESFYAKRHKELIQGKWDELRRLDCKTLLYIFVAFNPTDIERFSNGTINFLVQRAEAFVKAHAPPSSWLFRNEIHRGLTSTKGNEHRDIKEFKNGILAEKDFKPPEKRRRLNKDRPETLFTQEEHGGETQIESPVTSLEVNRQQPPSSRRPSQIERRTSPKSSEPTIIDSPSSNHPIDSHLTPRANATIPSPDRQPQTANTLSPEPPSPLEMNVQRASGEHSQNIRQFPDLVTPQYNAPSSATDESIFPMGSVSSHGNTGDISQINYQQPLSIPSDHLYQPPPYRDARSMGQHGLGGTYQNPLYLSPSRDARAMGQPGLGGTYSGPMYPVRHMGQPGLGGTSVDPLNSPFEHVNTAPWSS